jgi:DNA polymerase III delta' subunit
VTSSDDALGRLGDAGERLRRAATSGRVAPAYLFEGPDLAAPRAAARAFAAAMLCDATGDRPCGTCRSCRRVASGSHPDVHVQGRDKSTVISVEAMEALLERAHAKPFEGRRQAFLVEPADALAPEGIARYLKTLEEPPASTTFVLVTDRPDRLPDTVRSRCQRVRFPPATADEIAAAIAAVSVDPVRAARIARLSGGSTARAERVAALGLDEAARDLAGAARPGGRGAATVAEDVLAALRAKSASAPEEPSVEAGDDAASTVSPGEGLRRALEDLFHVLCSLARDRVAGRGDEAGGFEGLSRDDAAEALPRLSRLASLVRRNVAPAILLVEAASALGGPALNFSNRGAVH